MFCDCYIKSLMTLHLPEVFHDLLKLLTTYLLMTVTYEKFLLSGTIFIGRHSNSHVITVVINYVIKSTLAIKQFLNIVKTVIVIITTNFIKPVAGLIWEYTLYQIVQIWKGRFYNHLLNRFFWMQRVHGKQNYIAVKHRT